MPKEHNSYHISFRVAAVRAQDVFLDKLIQQVLQLLLVIFAIHNVFVRLGEDLHQMVAAVSTRANSERKARFVN